MSSTAPGSGSVPTSTCSPTSTALPADGIPPNTSDPGTGTSSECVPRTLVEASLDAMRSAPGRELLVHRDRRLTAGHFWALVQRTARVIASLDLDRGAVVTLLGGNLPEVVAARYAANLAGHPVNQLYSGLSTGVQAATVRDVEAQVLIVDPRFVDRAVDITTEVPVPHVFVLGDSGRGWGTDLLALAGEQSDASFAARCRPGDACAIRHTGGTTGRPKGIVTTFDQADWVSRALSRVRPGADGTSRPLVCTPLAHAAGIMLDGFLSAGGTAVLQDEFDAGEVLAAVERERVTHLFLLPPLLYRLLDHPDSHRRDLSSLRNVIYTGCQASPSRIADAVRRFGPVLVQVYAQSETGTISALGVDDHAPDDLERLRSAGEVLPGVEVAVRDRGGADLPVGEPGEICVRSPGVMRGYWKQPELTADVLRDGWVHTGDIGRLDAEGYLTVVDRIKDMIVVVGGHVYPTELEELLDSHPDVVQSAVFGVRDADRVEQVHAVVVTAPGAAVRAADLRAAVRDQRGSMYEPARIDFAEALPLTNVGKPDKALLRRKAEERRRTPPGT